MKASGKESGNAIQVVVFILEEKSLAIDILKVQEIIRMAEITPVPKMPPFALGVINIRGQIVPIINLREKLHLPARPPDIKTCIMLVRASGHLLGFLVDDVAEVLTLPVGAVDRPDEGPEWITSDLFFGVGKLPGRLLVIIDPDRFLSPREERELRKAGSLRMSTVS